MEEEAEQQLDTQKMDYGIVGNMPHSVFLLFQGRKELCWQGKRILIPQQMEQVAIVPSGFEALPVDSAF
jgi:hypothetical protein